MVVDISDMLTVSGKQKEVAVPVTVKQISYGSEPYPIGDASTVLFTFIGTGKKQVLIEGSTRIYLGMPCVRCLETVDVLIEFTFAYRTAAAGLDEVAESDAELFWPVEGGCFEADDLIIHELIMNLPTRVLCHEDCMGICRECGQNLNIQDCGCDRYVPHPGMAAVKDIFNACKEV